MSIENIEENLSKTAALLKAFANEKRLLIACVLYRGECSVGELEGVVGLSQSALSQHLGRLRRDGLVKTRRDAQTIFYSLTDHDDDVQEFIEFLCHLNCPERKKLSENS